MLNDCNVMYIS
uniref:Uncharacterized protein n=1 Tax=Anguilla anguilla TaxID=7936 RepID=A0A0E9THT8_ANGAN